jgi:hypothetical protein
MDAGVTRSMDTLSEDALVLAVLFMYLPQKRQKEILEQISSVKEREKCKKQ